MQATIKKVQVECGKCNGKGNIQAFRHIEKGDCFACCGEGKVWVPESEVVTQEQIDKLVAKFDRKHDARRVEFFSKMTLEKFASLTSEQRKTMATWVEMRQHELPGIMDRWLNSFRIPYLNMQ